MSAVDTRAIPKRRFGRYDDEVTIIALGGGHIIRKNIEREMALEIITTAIDAGINFIDEAWDYGDGVSEMYMGEALENRWDDLFLATKVCARGYAEAAVQIDESLTRLRTDSVDLLQLHECNYDNDPDLIFAEDGALRALLEAREQGKTRYIGFTGHKHPAILVDMLDRNMEWDCCQIPINVLDSMFRSFAGQVLPGALEQGMACVGMKSLGGFGQIASETGLTAQECRRYALSQPITTLTCGITSLRDLEQDLAIARDFVPMTEAEQAALRDRVRDVAVDGRHEWFKTTNFFDNAYHRDQHGYPEQADIRAKMGF